MGAHPRHSHPPLKGWVPLIPLHIRMLQQLEAQRKKDPIGALGWAALRDERDRVPLDQALEPLKDRRLVEDCSAYRPAGHLFGRLTTFGFNCLMLGLMPVHAVRSAAEVNQLVEVLQRESERRTEAEKKLEAGQ